jgi:hypothetical protein
VDDFIAQLIAGEVVEPISGTMAGDQVFRIDLVQSRDDLSDVGVIERRNDMEAANNGMHLLDARHGLGLPNRVDDAAMAAGGENYQTLALDDKVGTDLECAPRAGQD